ncbi:MAG: sugar ABC transporter ATP-binding protein [Brevinema sp.]
MSDIIFSAKGVCKSFFNIPVLKNVDFTAYKGEVHAVLGENGAGKSTLMKIMAGVYTMDSGELAVDGTPVQFHKPADAIANKVVTIHQELNMCTHLTVLENIFLAREYKTSYGFLDRARMKEAAKTWLKRFGLENDLDRQVKKMPISKQQVIEIARAVSMSSQVLIMDEPTSSLSERETAELFSIIKDLKSIGISIIYITHRLEELEIIADRVTVLRDGNFVMSKPYKETTVDEIISAMAGRDITEKYPRISCSVGETVLSVKNLTCEPYFRDVSFDVKQGEILGFAGLVGAGRSKIAKAVGGVFHPQQGKIVLQGKELHNKTVGDAIRSGIAYVSEDRKQEGLALKMSILENVGLPNMNLFASPFYIRHQQIYDKSIMLQEQLKIKMRNPHDRIQFLSGGNQQKVMIGKWMVSQPKVFFFDEPTRGVDVNAKINIYTTINELKANNIGVAVISSELPELLGICDRILVVSNGKITGEVIPGQTTQEEILHYATINY